MNFLFKKVVKTIFHSIGLDIIKYSPSSNPSDSIIKLLNYHKIDLVVDIGANSGQYAMYLLDHGYSGQIISFEPVIESYKKLFRNRIGYQNWKIAKKFALGDQNKEATINVANNFLSSSILPMLASHKEAAPESSYIKTERINVHKLDDLKIECLWEAKNPFLKIDAQGYEFNILKGAKKYLKKCKGVQTEVSLVPLYEGERPWMEIFNYLIKSGFNLCDILPGFRNPDSGRLLQMDGIFFRDR